MVVEIIKLMRIAEVGLRSSPKILRLFSDLHDGL